MDEIRISNIGRGSRWIHFSAENQKPSSTFLSISTEYLIAPQLSGELNASVAQGIAFSYAIPTSPPATSYSSVGLPLWATLNVATGEITGTPDAAGVFTATVTATNAKGSNVAILNLQSAAAPTTASINSLGAEQVEGRSATILGDLNSTGGEAPAVFAFYGKVDSDANASAWDSNMSLGPLGQGTFNAALTAIDSGATYYFRFRATNSAGTVWSNSRSFTTKAFDQGIVRIHTGDDELGSNSGVYWNKGAGESKLLDANFSTVTYVAPDGSAWPVTTATFHFPGGLFLGSNIDSVLLEGRNSLSLQVDGNVTIAKSFSGAAALANAHITGGTALDGHDPYYGDDVLKGNRVGQNQLGGYGGNQGPGRGYSAGVTDGGGNTGGGGSYGGEGGQAASGPSGLLYGSGALDVLIGGSGGGSGNLGEAAAGGGVLEISATGNVYIDEGVKISMNGGTVFVNPTQGAYMAGGAGSGGSIRLRGASVRNLGTLEARGGDSAGQDPREQGQRYRLRAGGAGGGGRVQAGGVHRGGKRAGGAATQYIAGIAPA